MRIQVQGLGVADTSNLGSPSPEPLDKSPEGFVTAWSRA